LYNRLNRIPGVSCDRAFTPAPDFEALLKERGISLYGLDTGIPLADTDILCFTLGYELGITGLLTILEAAFIPLRAAERSADFPLVVMGGPCVSNPLPYADFIDAFWIGEAEGGFFSLVEELAELKRAGAGKAALYSRITAHPSIWVKGKERAIRALDRDFDSRGEDAAVFPVPNMKAVQNHGALEIMRGCPNGCRFCHAGYWYRPMRQKNAETIRAEAAAFINQGGYREISLSSLSTGDYQHIDSLVKSLSRSYASSHISFQLPSLRISSFSLRLLEEISLVRKSGLTFAVETPVDGWQLALNKKVNRDQAASILGEAKKNGWRGAKFYFMIGLPVGNYREGYDNNHEEVEIVDFIKDIARRTGMHFSVNVGIFVPKPHTPYQWTAQIDEENAREKLDYIRQHLKPLGHKVSVSDPFTSLLEGIISRGDERVGELLEEAFRKGCRLDAWSEYIKKDIWQGLFEKFEKPIKQALKEQDPTKPLPWKFIESGISPFFFKREFSRSENEESTSLCMNKCTNPCGICSDNADIVQNNIQYDNIYKIADGEVQKKSPALTKKAAPTWRILFSFSKQGSAVFQSHLSLIEIFSAAFLRAGLQVLYSQGYNPLPRLEIASPLAIGITAASEIAAVDLEGFLDAQTFSASLNPKLPDGLKVINAVNIYIPPGEKKHSLSSLLWGGAYPSRDNNNQIDYISFADEKSYRKLRIESETNFLNTGRLSVLAKNPAGDIPYASYFTVYRDLYPSRVE
ncbi:MAG: TIGR03936 family radical SAM-associated protein, partial [Treponema sp.]|nr:TIGR03936 family radical SAM-associated protein [Treponema sp.]